MVTGAPTLEPDELATAVVVRLVRRIGSEVTWLEVVSEEGRDVRLVTTLDSGRRLLAMLHELLTAAAT